MCYNSNVKVKYDLAFLKLLIIAYNYRQWCKTKISTTTQTGSDKTLYILLNFHSSQHQKFSLNEANSPERCLMRLVLTTKLQTRECNIFGMLKQWPQTQRFKQLQQRQDVEQ